MTQKIKETIEGLIEKEDRENLINFLFKKYHNTFFSYLKREYPSVDEDTLDESIERGIVTYSTYKISKKLDKKKKEYRLDELTIRFFCKRRVTQSLDRQKNRKERKLPENTIMESSSISFIEVLEKKDMWRFIFSKITETCAEIFKLYIEGYKHKDIGIALAITEGTSKKRLSRCVKSARAIFLNS